MMPSGGVTEEKVPVLKMLLNDVPFVSPAASLLAQAVDVAPGAQPGRPSRKSGKELNVMFPMARPKKFQFF
jgi:hypothetical protein